MTHEKVIGMLGKVILNMDSMCDAFQGEHSGFEECAKCPFAIMDKGGKFCGCSVSIVNRARALLMEDEKKFRVIADNVRGF